MPPLLRVTLEAARHVAAPRARAWAVFCRLTGWQEWSAGGLEASLRPLGLPLALRVTVEEAEVARRVVWRGRGLGVASRHEFSFEDLGQGCRVTSRESLAGWMLLALRPFYSPRRLAMNAQEWLAGLAALAERETGRRV
ncbi:MAG: hypothetical protein ACOZHQ_10780 [Thermodesulfobacteriota bacterium]